MRRSVACLASAALLVVLTPASSAANCDGTSTGLEALTDLGPRTYRGAQGGLYPGGSSEPPLLHTQMGLALAGLVVPRDPSGRPDEAGNVIFVGVGMSNAANEFGAFASRAASDPLRDPRVLVVNGAMGGQTADVISDPSASYWTQLDALIAAAGGSPAQVQAAWIKEAVPHPDGAFPDDARELEGYLRSIVAIMGSRFPNLRLVYLSSRIYAGYASTALNPEPYAYASGFAVKWLIGSQITVSVPTVDPSGAGSKVWMSWGPYLWADGVRARSDGLTWVCADFGPDGTHPSGQGAAKVAGMLFDFVHTDPTAWAWYAQGGGACDGVSSPRPAVPRPA